MKKFTALIVVFGLIIAACTSSADDNTLNKNNEGLINYVLNGETLAWHENIPEAESPVLNSYPPGFYRIEGIAVWFHDDSPAEVNDAWVETIRHARSLIPESLYLRILKQETLTLEVAYEPTLCEWAWAFGCGGNGTIKIQEGQDVELAKEIDPEPTAKDGVTSLERLKVFIHEFGHVVGDTGAYELINSFSEQELSPTTYGQRNYAEDFSESFSFYLLCPMHLKNYHPSRYLSLQSLLGDVMENTSCEIPASTLSKLSYGLDGFFVPNGYPTGTYTFKGEIISLENNDPQVNSKYVKNTILKSS